MYKRSKIYENKTEQTRITTKLKMSTGDLVIFGNVSTG